MPKPFLSPQKHLDQHQIYSARGKLLGGTSVFNALIYDRCSPEGEVDVTLIIELTLTLNQILILGQHRGLPAGHIKIWNRKYVLNFRESSANFG